MALAEGRVARSPLRLMVVVLLAAALVPAVLFVDASGVRSGYPFLEAGPLRAPAIVYYPTYVPPVVSPFGLGGGSTPDESAHLEMTYTLASGGELRIWESTRYGADVKDAVGMVVEEGSLSGSLAVWRSARTPGGDNVLYARIGQTLVVIAGRLAPLELLRIGDSLQRGFPSHLML